MGNGVNCLFWGKSDQGGNQKQLINFVWPYVIVIYHVMHYHCVRVQKEVSVYVSSLGVPGTL